MHYSIINKLSVFKDSKAFDLMLEAVFATFNGPFCEAWEFRPATYAKYDDVKKAPTDSRLVVFQDEDQSELDAGAYHFVNSLDRPTIVILGKPSADSGSTEITGDESLAGSTFHEVCEDRVDAYCVDYADGPDGKEGLAKETSDGLQGVPLFATTRDGTRVRMASAATPSYFDPHAKKRSRKFDLAGAAESSFQLIHGGYQVWRKFNRSTVGEVFASKYPGAGKTQARVVWCDSISHETMAHKMRKGSRLMRRLANLRDGQEPGLILHHREILSLEGA